MNNGFLKIDDFPCTPFGKMPFGGGLQEIRLS
jgi:hypothetical protein